MAVPRTSTDEPAQAVTGSLEGSNDAPESQALARRAIRLLPLGLIGLMIHAFVPHTGFIERFDDAFYYFGVAANYPTLGHWSFDTLHPTNGVQPLWALILSGVAQALSTIGVTGREVLARIFVLIAACLNFASSVFLFKLLVRRLSVGTAIIAAGAFLFSPAIVWGRVSGMENALYALLLTATLYFLHAHFLERPSRTRALALGLLLGLTALTRLNAGILIPCLLAFLLLRRTTGSMTDRLRWAFLVGAAASLLLAPYLINNYIQTGHALPISGAVKGVMTEHFLEEHDVDRRFSPAYIVLIRHYGAKQICNFVVERGVDGLWPLGAWIVLTGDAPTRIRNLGIILGIITLMVHAKAPWGGLAGEFIASQLIRSIGTITSRPDVRDKVAVKVTTPTSSVID